LPKRKALHDAKDSPVLDQDQEKLIRLSRARLKSYVEHFVRLQIGGHESLAVPVLLSSVETYDVKRGGEFFAYLQFQFLVVEKDRGSADLKAVSEGSSSKLVGMEGVSGFMEQVGRNTDYIIHPEEILADNFALLVLNSHTVASPEIPRKMREVLMRRTTS